MSGKGSGGRKRSRDELKALPESVESAVERAARLRQKTEELRAIAETMTDRSARMSLLCLAGDYERLSDYANHRAELARRFRSRMTG